MSEGVLVIATNRKAAHDFDLGERFESGMVLQGSEIKSIRARQVSLREAYVRIESEEAWLLNAHIAPYNPASKMNHDPRRRRKLLLHRREIQRLQDKVIQKGFTIVPTRLYLKGGRAKLEIALAKGKRKYDKRREIAKKDVEREVARMMRGRR